ncbi:MAG: DUF885 domain-containing protein, partial [Salegentibacter mishustinae]|nr:DUF885 domain-containing protein [Salegentibacter mishustinae]
MRIRFIHKIFYLGLLVFIISCNQQSESYSEEEIKEHSAELNEYFEEEFQKDVEESPMMQTRLGQKTNYGKWDNFSHLKYAEDRNKAKRRLGDLKKIDPSSLDEETRLSYDLYLQKQENILEDYDFRFYNYPVNQMFGYHAELPAFLINMHRIDSISDAEAYISRLKGIPKVMEDVIGNLKIREQNGIMPPIFVFDRVLESSRNVIKGKPFGKSVENSALLEDFKSKIDDLEISQKKKKELISKAETALTKEVKPAYQNLIVFLETQQKRANSDAGAWKFPKGEEFYANALKRATTTNLSANQIHEIGLSEVARIHAEMEKIKKKVGFKGTLQDFFEFMRKDEQFYYANDSTGRNKYLTEARSIINTMKDDLDKLFLTKPEAELVVKAVEPFREKNAGKAFYQQPAKDGSRPGTYYANLYDMSAMPTYQMEALAYHEGIPGHHMQIAIAQELEEIPQFRKFSFYTAYVEGWGLYSELLPKEIGYYKDP